VTFTSFKQLPFYVTCSGGVGPIVTGPTGDVTTLDQAKQQIKELTARVADLQQSLTDRDQKLLLANSQISDLQRRIAQLTGGPTTTTPDNPATPSDASLQTRVLALQRALQLTNQMFDSQREICKVNQSICKPVD
jgi:hypothetical protein